MGTGASPARARIAYLDGIRAVAVLAVVSYHLGLPYVPILHAGYVGVDVFFVVSGYIITRILWTSGAEGSVAARYGRFMWQRVRRLYPALLGMLVVGVVVIGITGVPVGIGDALANAGIAAGQAMNFYMGAGGGDLGPSPFAHTWSLANEWVFYLIWPVLLLIARQRGLRAWYVAWGAVVAAVACYLAALPMDGAWFYFGPVSRAAQLLAGCALALFLVSRRSSERRARAWVGDLLVFGSVAALIVWILAGPELLSFLYRFTGFPLATAIGVAMVAAGELFDPGLGVAFLSLAPMTYVGRISYSVYLWHLLPIVALGRDTLPLPRPLVAVVAIGAVVGTSLASYYALERPFLRARPRTPTLQPASESVT